MLTEENKPDFEEFRKVLLLKGEPKQVPIAELLLDREVKEAYLGKPVLDVKTDIEFWTKAGRRVIKKIF